VWGKAPKDRKRGKKCNLLEMSQEGPEKKEKEKTKKKNLLFKEHKDRAA